MEVIVECKDLGIVFDTKLNFTLRYNEKIRLRFVKRTCGSVLNRIPLKNNLSPSRSFPFRILYSI